MTWLAALTTGIGLGLATFGGLWLTVRHVLRHPHRRRLLGVSQAARLALVGVTFYGLSREGSGQMLAGLGGLWCARSYLLVRLGGVRRGR